MLTFSAPHFTRQLLRHLIHKYCGIKPLYTEASILEIIIQII